MKGIILAGGLGTRLDPLTRITNKHLLPVYDKPMVYYPMNSLIQAGISEIMLVTGGAFAGDFLRLLGNGEEFGIKKLHYTYQHGEGGIAAALSLAEDFSDGDKTITILGDNIFEDDLTPYINKFEAQSKGARLLLKEANDARRFGVPELQGKLISRIDEKPERPASQYAVTGIYMYDSQVFDIIRSLKPSDRGELEITDVNNAYIQMQSLEYDFLSGFWSDAGTFESLYHASELVRKKNE